jgi:lipopolysaccharide transport system ATP-binding protein
MTDIAIKVQNLSKCYHIYDNPRDRLKQFVVPRLQRLVRQSPNQYFREFWALKDVSFEVKKAKPSALSGATAAVNLPCCK